MPTTNQSALQDLAETCSHWAEADSEESFDELVSEWLEITGKPQKVLAKEFETSVATISRWSNGKVVPHSMMQEFVVETLGRRLRSMLEATRMN
jgi:ribosome-binding protein aMBF1 (putative translation factor)